VARCIEDAKAVRAIQSGGYVRSETALGQPYIQYRKIGLVTLTEFNRLPDGTRDATHLIPAINENLRKHVGHHKIVFGDHDCGHRTQPFSGEIVAGPALLGRNEQLRYRKS
jgi:hypothetical protein